MQIVEQEKFGPFLPYIFDEYVTDIDYNGHMLWITDLKKGRYRANSEKITEQFVEQFSNWVANWVNKPFNRANNIIEAEMNQLRISIVHESAARSGRSISIRKSPANVRHTKESLIKSGYCPEEIFTLLKNCVRARMNIVFCGEPGVGKTECAKFFSRFIPDCDRVITIEDTPEFHYSRINPGKDCVELCVNERDFGYSAAIKASLRQNPKWIMLSEARSREVKYLLECWSTGIYGFTTLHTDDVRKIPDRILNMIGNRADAERLVNDVYEFVNVGVLIRCKQVQGEIKRYIDQVCIFSREGEQNCCDMIAENGVLGEHQLPEHFRKRLRQAGILQPYEENQERMWQPYGERESGMQQLYGDRESGMQLPYGERQGAKECKRKSSGR